MNTIPPWDSYDSYLPIDSYEYNTSMVKNHGNFYLGFMVKWSVLIRDESERFQFSKKNLQGFCTSKRWHRDESEKFQFSKKHQQDFLHLWKGDTKCSWRFTRFLQEGGAVNPSKVWALQLFDKLYTASASRKDKHLAS